MYNGPLPMQMVEQGVAVQPLEVTIPEPAINPDEMEDYINLAALEVEGCPSTGAPLWAQTHIEYKNGVRGHNIEWLKSAAAIQSEVQGVCERPLAS